MAGELTEKQYLKSYNIHEFDIPLTSVDIVIFTVKDEQLQVLLVKRAQHPQKNRWALPGGFVDLKKDGVLLDTAKRKLFEKTGVKTPYLEQVETFGSATRDPRGWSVTVAYLALLPWENISLRPDSSSEEVTWVLVEKAIRKYDLAFDHAHILQVSAARLQSKVLYTSLPVNLLPGEFTLTDLQEIYELIMNRPVEKKSFRRRILDAEILEETGNMKGGSNRPAKLYRAKPEGEHFVFPRTLEGIRD